MSVTEPLPWLPATGTPLIAAMSTALPLEWCDTLPDVVIDPGRKRLETVGPQPVGRQELERREHAPVDAPAADVRAAAAVDLDARVAAARAPRAPPCPSAGSGRSSAPCRRGRRTGSCPWRGRSRSTRAASSRRGSASGRCAARRGRPGGSRTGRAARRVSDVLPMRPRIVPPMTFEPTFSCSQLDVLGLQAEVVDEVALERRRARHDAAVEDLVLAAGLPGRRALRARRRGAACATSAARSAPSATSLLDARATWRSCAACRRWRRCSAWGPSSGA